MGPASFTEPPALETQRKHAIVVVVDRLGDDGIKWRNLQRTPLELILRPEELDGFLVSTGWGTYGFKAAPIVGTTLAELVATGETPRLIAPFALERFHTDTLVSELAAAAVSH